MCNCQHSAVPGWVGSGRPCRKLGGLSKLCLLKSFEVAVDQRNGKTHDVEVAAVNGFDEFCGAALNGVASGFLHGFAAGYVVVDLHRADWCEADLGRRHIDQLDTFAAKARQHGLWLLAGAPEATLSSIDFELDYQQSAKKAFTDAGIPANRVRLIAGRATDVLPRMNEQSYDVVLVDADPQSVIQYVEHGLRLVRPGGTVLVAHALWRGRVADPAQRDDTVSGFRSLLKEIAASDAVISALSPVGDGLLQITKI